MSFKVERSIVLPGGVYIKQEESRYHYTAAEACNLADRLADVAHASEAHTGRGALVEAVSIAKTERDAAYGPYETAAKNYTYATAALRAFDREHG